MFYNYLDWNIQIRYQLIRIIIKTICWRKLDFEGIIRKKMWNYFKYILKWNNIRLDG